MTYQVNGTNIITTNLQFATTLLPKTINGINAVGFGSTNWVRPRFWNYIGTYGVFVGSRGSNYDYSANNTLGSSSLYYTGSSNLGYSYPCVRANSNHQGASVSGTWRHTSTRSRSVYGSDMVPALWCRIS